MTNKFRRLKAVKQIEVDEAYRQMLYYFFSYPNKETSLNDLSQALKIAKTTAKRVVLQLITEGFIKREILGKLWRISCNQNHKYNYTIKIAYNLSMIFESQILSITKEIIPNPKAIILFGSYRKGDDTEKSDIDIAVEVLGNEKIKIIPLAELPELGHRKNVMVNIHVFSRNNIDLNLFSNIANGILLEGFLEVKL